MRPDDLLRAGQVSCGRRVRPLDPRWLRCGFGELPAADFDDAARAANLVFHRRQRHRVVALAAGLVRQPPVGRIKRHDVAFLRILRGGTALDHVEAQVQRVAAKNIASPVAAHDQEIEPDLLGDGLETVRTHFTRGADPEALPGNHEGLAAMHALPKVGHQIAEGAEPPSLVEPVQALRDTVIRRRDLVGIDGVQLLPGNFRIPEDQGPPAHELIAAYRCLDRRDGRPRGRRGARLLTRRLDRVHEARDDSTLSRRSSTASAAVVVLRGPPRSLVVRRSRAADITAASICSAPAASPRCLSIIAAARIAPTGFAMLLPACLGADPCTGSNSPRRLSGLMFADGAWPRPPTSSDARSLRMSPNMLLVTTTSKRPGSLTSCIAAASTKRCSASMSDAACRSSAKTRCQRSCA